MIDISAHIQVILARYYDDYRVKALYPARSALNARQERIFSDFRSARSQRTEQADIDQLVVALRNVHHVRSYIERTHALLERIASDGPS